MTWPELIYKVLSGIGGIIGVILFLWFFMGDSTLPEILAAWKGKRR